MQFTDPHLVAFEEHRELLTGIAYRMLGSVSQAEDVVQDAWLRWSKIDVKTIKSPRAWLVTATSRLSLDMLKSAQRQREEYYGTWLPEPFLMTNHSVDVVEIDESVSIALMLVLEKLSPAERAGFLLHDVFGHTFEEVGNILDLEPANCRKMVSRARERVRAEKPRFTTTTHEHEELLGRFLGACRAGDMEPLMALLGNSASFHSDGGGKASAVRWVLRDREKIARFFIDTTRLRETKASNTEVKMGMFNGTPAMIVYVDDKPFSTISLEIQDGKIVSIYTHRNPDKLACFEKESI